MSDNDKCPKCHGSGALNDATQAWDCNELPPECNLCRGAGTWVGIEEVMAELHGQLAAANERAEKAERERDEANREPACVGCSQQVKAERDRLKAENARLTQERDDWQDRLAGVEHIDMVKLKAERDRLRDMLNRFPVTVDGVPVYPGLRIFFLANSGDVEEYFAQCAWCVVDRPDMTCIDVWRTEPYPDGDHDDTLLASRCYSTREAAAAAKKDGGK